MTVQKEFVKHKYGWKWLPGIGILEVFILNTFTRKRRKYILECMSWPSISPTSLNNLSYSYLNNSFLHASLSDIVKNIW